MTDSLMFLLNMKHEDPHNLTIHSSVCEGDLTGSGKCKEYQRKIQRASFKWK